MVTNCKFIKSEHRQVIYKLTTDKLGLDRAEYTFYTLQEAQEYQADYAAIGQAWQIVKVTTTETKEVIS